VGFKEYLKRRRCKEKGKDGRKNMKKKREKYEKSEESSGARTSPHHYTVVLQ
jgi:hypothetical protein